MTDARSDDGTPIRLIVNSTEHELHPGRSISIGREPGSDVLFESPAVGRRHAELRLDADGVLWFRDLDSTNGSFVDGARAGEVRIDAEATIHLGGPKGSPLRVQRIQPAEAPGTPVEPPTEEALEEVSGEDVPAQDAASEDAPPETAPAEPSPEPAGRPSPAPGPAPTPTPPPTETQQDTMPLGRLTAVHEPRTVMRIGRDPGMDLVIDDFAASRRHAELHFRPDGSLEVVDLESHNGTFVNGQRVERGVVQPGDLITIGATLFRVTDAAIEQYEDDGSLPFVASGLGVTIAGRRLLDDVSFALEPSSLLGIVGPSGAGKSTLLNALTGFRPADDGSVAYGGRDLYGAFEELRSRMGYVPQSDILHLELTVRQALGYAAELRFPSDVPERDRQARVTEVMQELGLTERADVRVGSLSGGQRKRVSVGVELLTRPSLLYLDEPTSGLDPGREEDLMRLLRDLARAGRIVVVVTHSVQSLELCDRVLFLAPGGRTAFFGPPSEVEAYFAGPDGPRTPAEVFRLLEDERDRDWRSEFLADPAFDRYVRRPTAQAATRARSGAVGGAPVPQRPGESFRQFRVLIRRYLAVLRSDRRTILVLAIQAPLFGLLFMLLFGEGIFSPLYAFEATFMSWLLVVGATWLGTSNAVREIVKELPIYRRERTIGLSTGAYVASKVVVLGAITLLQCLVLVPIGLSQQEIPDISGVVNVPFAGSVTLPETGVLGWPMVPELMLGIALAGLAAMAVGLLVSSVVGNSDQAAFLLPVMLVGQIVVSVPLLGPPRPILHELGYFSAAQWGTSAVASTVGLNEIRRPFLTSLEVARAEAERRAPSAEVTAGRPEWRHEPGTWAADILAQTGLIVVGIAGAWIVLRRRDAELAPTRRRAGSRASRPARPAAATE